MCVKELLQSRFLYEFHELEGREVQCTLNFCIFLKVCGPVHSLNTNSIYLSILQTGYYYFLICLHPETCPWVVFFFLGVSFTLSFKSPIRKLPFVLGRKKIFGVLLLRFQNKVLEDIAIQDLPVVLLTELLRCDDCSAVSHGWTCLLPLPLLT